MKLTGKKQKATVGLDIETASIAAAEVHVNGSARVGRTGIAPLSAGVSREGEVTDPAELGAAIKDLFAESKLPRDVRIGLANQRLVVRHIRLPKIEKKDEIETAIRFQAQEQVPMPMDQSVLDWQVMEPSPEALEAGQMDVIVVAARREMVAALLEAIRIAGLRPVGLDVSAFAMIRAIGPDLTAPPAVSYEEAMSGDAPVLAAPAHLLCNLGDITNLVVARGKSCLFTRVSTFGIEGIAQRLAERRELTLEHSREWLRHVGLERSLEEIDGEPEIIEAARSVLEEGAEKLIAELRLSMDYYGTQETALAIESIVLTGPGTAIEGLPARIERELGFALSIGRPVALAELDDADAARLTVPFGLGLES